MTVDVEVLDLVSSSSSEENVSPSEHRASTVETSDDEARSNASRGTTTVTVTASGRAGEGGGKDADASVSTPVDAAGVKVRVDVDVDVDATTTRAGPSASTRRCSRRTKTPRSRGPRRKRRC